MISQLGQGPLSETLKISTEPESEHGQAYSTLKSLFDQTKKIYSQQDYFLSANELKFLEPQHRSTIRTANLATFVSSIFAGQDVQFYELNDHFVDTFTADGQPLQKEPGELYLNLKTQMYLSAVQQEEQEQTREDILDELFPPNLEDILRTRRYGEPLSQDEVQFIHNCTSRRNHLAGAPTDIYSIRKSEPIMIKYKLISS